MKCKCSLNNNYEVIGLCDLKEFNEKIKNFTDNSWTQITIPEILKLPDSEKDIEKIIRVYISIKIDTAKIINTPSSDFPNIEGLFLTGKLLLVHGHISQKVIYTSICKTDPIKSKTFNVKFNTYITIDANADPDKDNYCVYPCVENLFVKAKGKTIMKSINLFLFAHKIVSAITFLPNIITINSSTDAEVLQIKFIKEELTLSVSSTGTIPDATLGDTDYFTFTLYDNFGNQTNEVTIKANEDATAFASTLNNVIFHYGGSIEITYHEADKVIITNYPDSGTPEYNPVRDPERYLITEDGLKPYVYPSEIIISNDNAQMAKVVFDFEANPSVLTVTSTIETAPFNANQEYFGFILLSQSPNFNILQVATIKGRETANNLTTTLNNEQIQDGYIIKLRYKSPRNIVITNFNNQLVYNPKNNSEFYKITNNKLELFNPQFLPNKVSLKTRSNQYILNIQFSTSTRRFSLDATGINADTNFTVKLLNGNTSAQKFSSTFTVGNPADINLSTFDNIPFEINDILQLDYQDGNLVEITNFPLPTTQTYNPKNPTSEKYRVTNRGLELIRDALDNYIIVKNDLNEMSRITFKVIPGKTLEVTNESLNPPRQFTANQEYFGFTLINSSPTFNKLQEGSIKGQEDATNLQTSLNTQAYMDNYLVKLRYKIRTNIIVTNIDSNPNYNPIGTFEFFRITGNSLNKFFVDPLVNKVSLKNPNGQYILNIQFSKITKTFILDATGINSQTTFTVKLLNSAGSQEKASTTFRNGQPADTQLTTFDNSAFVFNDILQLDYEDGNLVEITNFPLPSPGTYNPKADRSEKYRITQNGLVLIREVLDTIIVVSNDTTTMSTITFKVTPNILDVTNDSQQPPARFNANQEYFGFVLINTSPDFSKLQEGTIKGQEDATNLVALLNNESFMQDYIVKLRYKDNNKITIINFNGQKRYTPTGTYEFFKITNNDLVSFPINKLRNIVKLKNGAGQYIANIEFNTITKTFILDPTGNTASSTFTIKLFDNISSTAPKLNVTFTNGQTADTQLPNLDNKAFVFNDILEIRYTNPTLVEITNFPNQGSPTYNPKGSNSEKYRITPQGLVLIQESLNSEIIVNNDTTEMSRITFKILPNNTLAVTNRNQPTPNRFNINQEYFGFLLIASTFNTLQEGSINGTETATNLVNSLNTQAFNLNNIIKLRYKERNNIIITNFGTASQAQYNPVGTFEFFKIQGNNLIKFNIATFDNIVKLKNNNGQYILNLYFSTTTKTFILDATGNTNNDSTFTVKLFDTLTSVAPSLTVTFTQGSTADIKLTELDNKFFDFGKILQLEYTQNNLVEITKFPIGSSSTYNPTAPNSEKYRITQQGLVLIKEEVQSEIIISNNSTEMSRITFQLNPRNLSVTNTGQIAPGRFTIDQEYFAFILLNQNLPFSKLREGTIKGTQSATNLVNSLNNQAFLDNNIVKLRYKENNNIVITNFNTQPNYNPKGTYEFFQIQGNTLIAFTPTFLRNTISLKTSSDDIVFNLKFITNARILLFDATGQVNDDSEFIFKLFDSAGTQKKLSVTISVNDTADKSLANFDNVQFAFNDIIELGYEDHTLVEITNFPDEKTPIYNPKGLTEKYRITQAGLVLIPNIYKNQIVLQRSDGKRLGSVDVNLTTGKLIVESTGTILALSPSTLEYLAFILLNSTFDKQVDGNVMGLSDASQFKNSLNNQDVQSEYIIKLRYKTSGFFISNYKGEDIYNATGSFEFMKVTQNGFEEFVPNLLPNVITLRNTANNPVVSISFMINPTILIVNPTKFINNNSTFTFKLLDTTGAQLESRTLNPNDSGDLMLPLDSLKFQFDYIVQLDYTNANLIEITNFPIGTTQTYKPKAANSEKYKITARGLELILDVLDSEIIVNNDTQEMSRISFRFIPNKILNVTNTMQNAPNRFNINQEYFGFVLLNPSPNFSKAKEGSIKGTQNANNLVTELNDEAFMTNYVVKLRYKENNKIVVTNFNNQPRYNPMGTYEFFRITDTKLTSFTANKLPNIITLKDSNNQPVFNLEFISNAEILSLDATGTVNDDCDFTLKLFDITGTAEKASVTIIKTETADISLSVLDNLPFVFNDIIELNYEDRELVEITNFPTIGSRIYNPGGLTERYRVTRRGLELIQNIYRNQIVLQQSGGRRLGSIDIDLPNNKLIVKSTGTPLTLSPNNLQYIAFILLNRSFTVKTEGTINGQSTADQFKNSLNNQNVVDDDIIKLRYKTPAFFISNYRNEDVYNAVGTFEFIKITQQGFQEFVPDLLPNIVRFKSLTTGTIVSISFMTNPTILIVNPTRFQNTNNTFTFKLLNNLGADISSATLTPNSLGDLMLTLDSLRFQFSYILELQYTDANLVEITDFPIGTGQTYNPQKANSERYRITPQGLVLIADSFENEIIINDGSSDMSKISFNVNSDTLTVTNTGVTAPRRFNINQEFFAFVLMEDDFSVLKNGIIKGTEDAANLVRELNTQTFMNNYTIKLRYKNPTNVVITNFEGQSKYTPKGTFELYAIKPSQLEKLNFELLPNTIRLKTSATRTTVFNIMFIKSYEILVLDPKGITSDSNFTFRLFDSAGTTEKFVKTFPTRDTADNHILDFDNEPFQFDDILELVYDNNLLVEITNFPDRSTPIYTPKIGFQQFRITENGLVPIQPFYINQIILKSQATILGTVDFNTNNNTLTVASTGSPVVQGETNVEQLAFILASSNFDNILKESSIQTLSNANQFRTALNNRAYANGDLIKLRYKDPNYIITNYKNQPVYEVTNSYEFLEITDNKLVFANKNLLRNTITLKNTNGSVILTIQFMFDYQIIIISPTNTKNNDSIFKISLLNSIESVIASATINPDEYGDMILPLDCRKFAFNYIIKLEYNNPSLIEITNFPNQGDPTYNPQGISTEKYIILGTGLQIIHPPIDSAIIIRNDTDEMSRINFEIAIMQVLQVSNSGKPTPPKYNINQEFFGFVLMENIAGLKQREGSILGTKDATILRENLNNQSFKVNYIFKLRYKQAERIEITNFKGQPKYMPKGSYEYFQILSGRLDSFSIRKLDNVIRLKNRNNTYILNLEFMTTFNRFILDATGVTNTDSPIFTVKLLNDTGLTQKAKITILQNQTADAHLTSFDNRAYLINDILELQYDNPALVEITNFPRPGTGIYHPSGTSERYRITQTGLLKLESEIILKVGNQTLGNIKFNFTNNTLNVTSTGRQIQQAPDNLEFLSFMLISNNFSSIKLQSSVNGLSNANRFANALTNEPITAGDIIKLRYKASYYIITNYKNQLRYQVPGFYEFIEIKQNFITPLKFTPLQNVISFKNIAQLPVATLEFITNVNGVNFLAISPDFNGSLQETFTIKLLDDSDVEVNSVTLTQNSPNRADALLVLDNTKFDFDYVLELRYTRASLIQITNFPNPGSRPYSPKAANFERYIITPNGLKLDAPTFKNKILINNDTTDMAEVDFNLTSKRLIITKTNQKTPNIYNSAQEYFGFVLIDNTFSVVKQGTIKGQEDATNLQNELNFNNFDINYLIKLRYKDPDKIVITNFKGQAQYNPQGNFEFYRIDSIRLERLTITTLPNVIKLKDAADKYIFEIKIIRNPNILLFNATGIIADSDFTFTLLDSAGSLQKFETTISIGETADEHISEIDNEGYELNDIIDLSYENNLLVEITQFPNFQTAIYVPQSSSQRFKITSTTLVPVAPYYLNEIVLRPQGTTIANVKFNYKTTGNSILDVSSTGETYPTGDANLEFMALILIRDTTVIKTGIVKGSSDAQEFEDELDSTVIQNNDLVKLRYKESSFIITNYKSNPIYTPINNFEFMTITPNGLSPLNATSLINTIRFRDTNGEIVVSIQLLTTRRLLAIIPTTWKNTRSTFTIKLLDSSQVEKASATINPNQYGDELLTLDNISYVVGDIIQLDYTNGQWVDITNFPNPPTVSHPAGTSSKYRITTTKLEVFTPPPATEILVKNDFQHILRVKFNISESNLSITSINNWIPNEFTNNHEYFAFVLMDKNFNIINHGVIKYNKTTNSFISSLNKQKIEHSNIIKLRYKKSSNVVLLNYKGNSEYNPSAKFEFLQLLNNAIEEFPIILLPNIIRFKNKDGSYIFSIKFSVNAKIIILESTGIINTDSLFIFNLFSETEKTSRIISIFTEDYPADTNLISLDNQKFEFNDILEIGYTNPSLVEITNLNQRPVYNPSSTSEKFKITENGLIKI